MLQALWLATWLVAAAAPAPAGQRESLCPGSEPYVDDHVVALCARNFPVEGTGSYSRWAVHFYGRACRRCREAAAAVLEAAQPEPGLRVLFGAVDCHDAQNHPLCKEHGVWKLPTVRALGSNTSYTGALEPQQLRAWALAAVRAAGGGGQQSAKGRQPLCPAHELYDEPHLAREFLRAHNVYRCMAGLQLLVWDTSAFATAKRWAAKAPADRLQHSPEEERRGPHGKTYGENVAIGEWLEPGQVVARWHDEIRSSEGGRGGAAVIGRAGLGHYTQLVWRSTRRVGCSMGQHRRIAICHYDPAGNERGRHLTQVAPPLPGYGAAGGEERCGGPVEGITA